ncbi:MAG TPA: DsbA family oxidoreductase [Pseudorhodoplanes sp.]|nr:DsbA family oxidoreductase [Pseudorhodoplanes sp.]
MPQSQTLPIDVVSDVVCPWCFIGKKRIEQAIALKPAIPVTLRFHPYFLNDWIPREGISREDYLIKKFGSIERYAQIAERVKAAAAEEGLVYAPEKISRQPNTTDCHRLILWADKTGNAARMKQRLMDLYFTEGGDLTSNDVLAQAAADIGLDRAEISKLLATDQDLDVVAQQAQNAKDAGIDGVPCFIFAGALAVSGAQAPDYLAGAIERAAEQIAKQRQVPA